ncbi:hypothetical protein [Lentibacillus amyloliquefaciens]|nr:hypothetical protein [Lentibacillus amyloliquefaciens]
MELRGTYTIFLILQVILTAFTFYKFMMAIDINYQLVLEKTHKKTV